MGKVITSLDGNTEEQTKALKELFGLSPDQSFQDMEIEEEES